MSCVPMVPMKLSEMWSSGRARKCETIGKKKATMTLRMTWQSGGRPLTCAQRAVSGADADEAPAPRPLLTRLEGEQAAVR